MKINKNNGVDLNTSFIDDLEQKLDKHITNMFKNGNLKRITSEKEYWEQHKIYKKKISKLFRKSYKFISNPYELLIEIEYIWSEMEFIGVVNNEWVTGQRLRLYNELNKPSEFKEWVSYNIDKVKSKIKRKKD